MSVIAGVGKAIGAEVLTTGATPARGRVFLKRKCKLVVMAVALITLSVLVALIAGSETPKAEHSSSAVNTNSQSQTEAAVSEPGTASQMSQKEALDAYGKLPLNFIPNQGQSDEAVRYYSQGAGYGFFFTPKGALLSFAEGKEHGHALALDFLGADPDATLTAERILQVGSTTLWETSRTNGSRTSPLTQSSSTADCGRESTWPCGEKGVNSSTSSTSSPAHRLTTFDLLTAEPRGSR